jgi:hypothetical protein
MLMSFDVIKNVTEFKIDRFGNNHLLFYIIYLF